MRRIFLVASLVILSLSNISLGHGYEIDIGPTFLGKTEIEMVGSNTITGDSITLKPNNKLGYTGSVGYVYEFHERFTAKGALGFTLFNTESVTASGASESSGYEGNILDLQLIMQFDVTNNWGLRAGANYPITMNIKGVIDNVTGVDEFNLSDQSFGFIAGGNYNFSKSIHLRLDYMMVIAKNTTAGNNLDLRVHANFFRFLIGYQF